MKTAPSRTTALRQIAAHLLGSDGDHQRRWIMRSTTGDPDLVISIIASRDQGAHQSGWWRNSQYDACWHVSICALDESPGGHSYADLPADDLAAIRTGVFGPNAPKTWTEPPASKLDPYRNAPASAYTTHLRLFFDRAGHPIQPIGEVYSLQPWAEGDSPAKVFRT